jgi:hypothetical protein
MAVRLAVPAVVAANCRLDDALAVLSGRKAEKAATAGMRRFELCRRRRRNGMSGVSRDGIANERAKFLLRDFH